MVDKNQYQSQTEHPFGKAHPRETQGLKGPLSPAVRHPTVNLTSFEFLRHFSQFSAPTCDLPSAPHAICEERPSTLGREERTAAVCGADLGSHTGDAGRPLHQGADRGRSHRSFVVINVLSVDDSLICKLFVNHITFQMTELHRNPL